VFESQFGGIASDSFGSEIYFVGIIDTLTSYNGKKKAANFFKNFLWRNATLSTVPAEYYGNRLFQFVLTIFHWNKQSIDDYDERPPLGHDFGYCPSWPNSYHPGPHPARRIPYCREADAFYNCNVPHLSRYPPPQTLSSPPFFFP
jgi:hypothetical protein